jgi:hypothetical protein
MPLVPTPIDGFRKNLEATLPELEKDCVEKIATLDAQLDAQRVALAYVRGLMAHAGVKSKPAPSEGSDAGGSNGTDDVSATSRSKD